MKRGEEVPERVVGAFVAAHFEEERSSIKMLLEDYCSSSTPRKLPGISPTAGELEQTTAKNRCPGRGARPASSELAVPVLAQRQSSPLAQTVTMAREDVQPPADTDTLQRKGAPEVSVTLRSASAVALSVETPPAVPVGTGSPQGGLGALRAIDLGSSSSATPCDEEETLLRGPVGLPSAAASLSPRRPSRRGLARTLLVFRACNNKWQTKSSSLRARHRPLPMPSPW